MSGEHINMLIEILNKLKNQFFENAAFSKVLLYRREASTAIISSVGYGR